MARYRIVSDSYGYEIKIAPEHMQNNPNFMTYDNFTEAQTRAVQLYENRITRLTRESKNLTKNMGRMVELNEKDIGGEA